MSEELIIDLQKAGERETLHRVIDKLVAGTWRIQFTQYRPRRTDRQNRYYWPCFVSPFGDFLRKCDFEIAGSLITDLQAHGILKHKFLRQTLRSPLTGEPWDVTLGTSALDVTQFNTYLDRCAAYLLTEFDIVVPEPRMYRGDEGLEEKEAARGAA